MLYLKKEKNMETEKIRTIDTIQKYIFGLPILNYKEVEKQILYNYSTIIERIEKEKINYQGQTEIIISILVTEQYVKQTYDEMTYNIINNYAVKYFKKKIEMAVLSEKLTTIKEVYIRFCQRNNLPLELQNKIISSIEKMANQNYETKSELYGDYALSPETTPSIVVSGPKIYHK